MSTKEPLVEYEIDTDSVSKKVQILLLLKNLFIFLWFQKFELKQRKLKFLLYSHSMFRILKRTSTYYSFSRQISKCILII